MNIAKLAAAAKEIDRLADLQETRTKRLQEIASKVKEAYSNGDEYEVRRLQHESKILAPIVVDFGGAINDLRRALRCTK